MGSVPGSWLDHVRLRARDEDKERVNGVRGNVRGGRSPTAGVGKTVVRTGGASCFVSVSFRSPSSPGAASGRYHAGKGQEAEVVREGGLDEWTGPRWSVVLAPEHGMGKEELVELGGRVLMGLEDRFGAELNGHAVVHTDKGNDKPHLHLAINDAWKGQRRFWITERSVGAVVERAMKEHTRERARQAERVR